MNKYENIYYKDFRTLKAYGMSLDVIQKIYILIGNLDSFEKANLLKKTIKIATEIAQAQGSILTKEGTDFHYRSAIKYAIKLKEELATKGEIKEHKEIISTLNQIIKLTMSYRKGVA